MTNYDQALEEQIAGDLAFDEAYAKAQEAEYAAYAQRELAAAELKAQQRAGLRTATVTTFKESGKYNTIHAWRVPADAIGPWDMKRSPDFKLPAGWTVLVDTDAAPEFPGAVNWGFPCLLRAEGK